MRIHLIALALVAAACGGGEPTISIDGDDDDPVAPTSGATTATTASDPVGDGGGEPPIDLDGTAWLITEYSQGPGFITNTWLTDVTISFADGTVSGTSGCNHYSASYEVSGGYNEPVSGVRDPDDGQTITFGPMAVTERACEDEDIMIQEGEILALLARAGQWMLRDGDLYLWDSEAEYLFNASPAG